MRRLFVALDLAIGVVEELLNIQEELHAHLGANGDLPQTRLRWTNPENIHLTLKFLGNTEDALISRLSETISSLVKPLFPFEVEARGVGFYPAPELPRIFWCGFDPQSAEVLALLQQAIERDLGELGFAPNDRPFHPHLTLGRVKSRANPDFASFAAKHENRSFGKSYVKDFVLYESILTPSGPVYQVIERFTLGA